MLSREFLLRLLTAITAGAMLAACEPNAQQKLLRTTDVRPEAKVASSLGSFAILNNGASQGNQLSLPYQSSSEGESLSLYWSGKNAYQLFSIVAVGSQFEFLDEGGRCATVNGSAVQASSCSNSSAQLFNLNQQPDDSYLIVSGSLCLGASGPFTNLQAASCSGTSLQSWNISGLKLSTSPSPTPVSTPAPVPVTAPLASNTYALLVPSFSQGNQLSLPYHGSSEGEGLGLFWAGTYSYQEFSVVALNGGGYEIVDMGSRCVTVSGSNVQVNTCVGSTGQVFNFLLQSNGLYQIQNQGLCLGAASAFGNIQAISCNEAATQLWQIQSFSSGIPVSGTPTPTPAPTTTPIPSPISSLPAPIAGMNYALTFDDEFTSLGDISASSIYNGAKWYNGNDQCCMGDSNGLPGVMYPTVYDGVSIDPYSLMSGGGLNITLSKVNNVWYSGVMTSVDQTGKGFSQQYGYFEMRAKLPAGPGTWPSFWMLSESNLTSRTNIGEIDIFEQFGQFPNNFCTTFHDWAAGTTPYYNCGITVANQQTDFHTYGFLWTSTTSTIYFDGVAVASTPTPAIMQQPYYMLVDLGLGGGWPTDQTPSVSTMQIEYVRAYAPN